MNTWMVSFTIEGNKDPVVYFAKGKAIKEVSDQVKAVFPNQNRIFIGLMNPIPVPGDYYA